MGSEAQIDMIVGGRNFTGFDPAQAARHPEMDDERAPVGTEEKVLGPTIDAIDRGAGQAADEPPRDRPSQPSLAHLDTSDPGSFHPRAKAPASGFDFWKFRHGNAFLGAHQPAVGSVHDKAVKRQRRLAETTAEHLESAQRFEKFRKLAIRTFHKSSYGDRRPL